MAYMSVVYADRVHNYLFVSDMSKLRIVICFIIMIVFAFPVAVDFFLINTTRY